VASGRVANTELNPVAVMCRVGDLEGVRGFVRHSWAGGSKDVLWSQIDTVQFGES